VSDDILSNTIETPPATPQFNYIVDLYNRWYRNSFYFCARYRCPAPNCISEFFEVRYTRLEYITPNLFALAYMRHTGKWQVVYPGLSLDDAISSITSEPIFHP
jgi:hypothetical protein